MKIRIIDAEEMGIHLNRKDGDIVEVYWDEANKVYQDKSHDYGYWIGWKDEFFEVLEEDSTEWSGEGLPPVNTECGVYIPGRQVWAKVKIVAHVDGLALFRNGYDGIFHGYPFGHFRPLKSQEEIEKEKQVEELNEHLDEWFNNIVVCPDNTYDDLTLSQYLYNLGYRKTE